MCLQKLETVTLEEAALEEPVAATGPTEYDGAAANRASVRMCFDNPVIKGSKTKRQRMFTTVTDVSSKRSLGFVMLQDDMTLAVVREKISVQFGSLIPSFEFVKPDSQIVPNASEATVVVAGDFSPVCLVKPL
eukprot:c9599_g1_i2.p1 GENE.c9599_g1_i2~~c9599_g1_i2.p1  ORF type:complete len:133 (+),score=35.54 c9599_g1_i2:26-424(+)